MLMTTTALTLLVGTALVMTGAAILTLIGLLLRDFRSKNLW